MPCSALPPTGLLVELLGRPDLTEIRVRQPKFSWIFNDLLPNARQTAFQIQVATSAEKLAGEAPDLWNSGQPDPGRQWAADGRSLHIPYTGSPLPERALIYWQVRTWNERNQASFYSEIQAFRTGEFTDAPVTARYLPVISEVEPRSVVRTASDRVLVDFGRAAFATLRLHVANPETGRELQVNLAEVPDGPLAINRAPGGSRRYRELRQPLRSGQSEYVLKIPADERNTRQVTSPDTAPAILVPDGLPEVVPFRYAEIVGAPNILERAGVRQLAQHYPFADEAAEFRSSSPVLNEVWEFCRYTIKATSFLGIYVDGDRERIPYEGDAVINQLGHYGCDREYALARHTHEYLLEHPNWPTEWLFCSVLMAWYDYLYTGDAGSLAAHYPVLQAKALSPLAREDGLLDTSEERFSPEVIAAVGLRRAPRDLVDWPQGERDGYELGAVNTVTNAFYYRVLVLLGRIAAALGKKADADAYRKQASRVAEAVREKLFDQASGLFVDSEGSSHASLHANLFPLAFGLLPPDGGGWALAFLRTKEMACSVYAAHFLLEAHYRHGQADAALARLTATGERSWARMFREFGATMAMEAWDDRCKPNQDWNHAWGAAPANLIPRWLLGVRPLTPGAEMLVIQPQPGNLAYGAGRVPTIRGPVEVSIEQAGGRFRLEATLPGNCSARVILPAPPATNGWATVDGQAVQGQLTPRGLEFTGIGSGRHTFVI